MAISIFQSCSKPSPLNLSTDETLYISECPCHGSQFDQNGDVLQGPAQASLTKYTSSLSDDNESITIENSSEIILLANHPSLLNIGGVSHLDSIDIDSKGVLIYRESVDSIIIVSRACTHEPELGCAVIDPFENS